MSDAERELTAQATVRRPVGDVWAALTDLRVVVDASPETVAMIPLGRGGLRLGRQYLGINRRGAVVWPTRSVVDALDPQRRLAWTTVSSGARWVHELAPDPADENSTLLTLRREMPAGLTRTAKVFARLMLGGGEKHADQLDDDVRVSVAELARRIEHR